MYKRQSTWMIAAAVVMGPALACVGTLDEVAEPENGARAIPPEQAAAAGGAGGGRGERGSTVIRRLNRTEYNNTVRDLLGDTSAPADGFPLDARAFGFDNNADALTVSPELVAQYFTAAEAMADRVDLGRLSKCDPETATDACVRAFVPSFGQMAFRRPLAPEEANTFIRLFQKIRATDTIPHALRAVVARFLASPQFLYRVELSGQDTGDAPARLTSWEMASRLSYLLWQSMPDPELFAAAAANALTTPDQIARQAERMLRDRRARAMVQSFNEQWMGLDGLDELRKDSKVYPAFADLLPLFKRETETFLDQVLWEGPGDVETLLGAPYSYLNARLAPFYGASAPGDAFVRVDLDPGKRAGLLTQGSLMASLSKADRSAPISRAVFLMRRLLCAPPPLPSNDVKKDADAAANNGAPAAMPTTTRQYYAQLTSAARCQACHAAINALGFAFEGYDAVGAWRDRENGVAVDTSGAVTLDGDTVQVASGVDVARALARSPQVHACIAKHWFRFAYGRGETEADAAVLEALGKHLGGRGAKVLDLVTALAETDVFLAPGYAPGRRAK